MAATTDLYDLCSEYLTACEQAVKLAPGGEIDRSFVSPGLPPWDCAPQLTVHAGGTAEADTRPTVPPLQPGFRTEVGAVNLVTMTATVIRCVHTVADARGKITFPKASELDSDARTTMSDLWAIWNHLRTGILAKTLFVTPLDRQRAVFFDPAVSLPSAGGFGGWEIQIRVELDGYRTA